MANFALSDRRSALTDLGRGMLVIAVAIGFTVGLAGCSSTSKSTTSGSNTQFEVSTPYGQASVSLNGQLPPNWPSDAPVPGGAQPAGSASLAGPNHGVMVGVYRAPESPEEVYGYYTTESSITVVSRSSAGTGSNFVGRVRMSAPIEAGVTIVPYEEGSAIVMVLTGGKAPKTTTTLPRGETGRR